MYACTCVCMYVCVHACLYVDLQHACMVYKKVSMYVCMPACAYMWLDTPSHSSFLNTQWFLQVLLFWCHQSYFFCNLSNTFLVDPRSIYPNPLEWITQTSNYPLALCQLQILKPQTTLWVYRVRHKFNIKGLHCSKYRNLWKCN